MLKLIKTVFKKYLLSLKILWYFVIFIHLKWFLSKIFSCKSQRFFSYVTFVFFCYVLGTLPHFQSLTGTTTAATATTSTTSTTWGAKNTNWSGASMSRTCSTLSEISLRLKHYQMLLFSAKVKQFFIWHLYEVEFMLLYKYL